jgi:hypothetical protein
MTAAGGQIAKWWNIQEQKILIAILKGIFAVALKDSHSVDISGRTGEQAVISANAVLDAKQLLGDAASELKAIAMHSAVFTALQKQDLIEYIPNSQGVIDFPAYLGYKIIVDDGIVPVNGVYNTYLFADGVFGRGDGVPDSLTPVEMHRDALASDDILVSRRALCLHPLGVSWTNPALSTATPANADLAAGVNWKKVADDKAIGIAMLRHKI